MRSVEFLQQRHDRVGCLRRIDIEHETVGVFPDRTEGKRLRFRLDAQIEHEPHHTWTIAREPDLSDEWIIRANAGGQRLELALQLDVLQIENQTFRALGAEQRVPDRVLGFDCHPRVVGARPNAHGRDRYHGFRRTRW